MSKPRPPEKKVLMKDDRANTYTAKPRLELSVQGSFSYPKTLGQSDLGSLYPRTDECASVFLQHLLYTVIIIFESQVKNRVLLLQASPATRHACLTVMTHGNGLLGGGVGRKKNNEKPMQVQCFQTPYLPFRVSLAKGYFPVFNLCLPCPQPRFYICIQLLSLNDLYR